MGLFSKSGGNEDLKVARAEHKAARRALERLPDDASSSQIDRANHRVVVAEKKIPWWQR